MTAAAYVDGQSVDRSGGPDACWPWLGYRLPRGYGRLPGGRGYAHRVAFEAAKGPIPNGMQVCHRCDNPPCCNPAHLFLGTNKDNQRDSIAKGRAWFQVYPERQVRGVRCHKAKLTDELVRQIRSEYVLGQGRVLADRYGVSRSAISHIVRGKTWTHVQ